MKIKDLERAVIKAALRDNNCLCKDLVCNHLAALWSAAENLARASRRQSRGGKR